MISCHQAPRTKGGQLIVSSAPISIAISFPHIQVAHHPWDFPLKITSKHQAHVRVWADFQQHCEVLKHFGLRQTNLSFPGQHFSMEAPPHAVQPLDTIMLPPLLRAKKLMSHNNFSESLLTWRRFSAGQSESHTAAAVARTGSRRRSTAATSRARPGASRMLRAIEYPVAGCTKLAAAPNAVAVWLPSGSGPPTGM